MEHILNIQTEEIQKDGKDTYYNHRYEPTPYELLDQFFDEYPLKKDDSFVDYGCGPGRVLFYIHHRFHCEVTGVEYNEEYYKKCVDNIKSYKGTHKKKVHVCHCGAQDYIVDDRQTVFYFFNPFSIEIFMHTLSQIQDSLLRCPREIKLIMYYPDSEYIYYLENYTEFCLTKTIPVGTGSRKDSRESFLIWQ
ncbi:MAG: class I SAM-dependent methyltransferase [bacterium]|nr:class I SAM-dependent methyltransferase [bacterium]